MRKLKLLSLLAGPAIVLPIVFSTTSCSAYSALNAGYKIIDVNSANKHLNELKKPNRSLHDLLWGDRSFNNGNYVLFLTHSDVFNSTSFLLNSPNFIKGENPVIDLSYAQQDSLSTTLNGNYSDYLPTTQYQFVVLVEEDTKESYCGDSSPPVEAPKPCSPFEKYTEQDEKINSDHEKDTYIRNDGAAKAYRKLMDTISKLFKGVDSSAAGSFLALQWVKGYPVTDNIKTDLPWKDNIEFANWLYANDQKGVSWK